MTSCEGKCNSRLDFHDWRSPLGVERGIQMFLHTKTFKLINLFLFYTLPPKERYIIWIAFKDTGKLSKWAL
jgi:hypothetical protein